MTEAIRLDSGLVAAAYKHFGNWKEAARRAAIARQGR
jgi:hypothetical protein